MGHVEVMALTPQRVTAKQQTATATLVPQTA
jgi:hypothetical protein